MDASQNIGVYENNSNTLYVYMQNPKLFELYVKKIYDFYDTL